MKESSSSSKSASRIEIPTPDAFVSPISAGDPVGSYLRYDTLYDEIRLARQEDDPRLSMGIWETELKRADWNKIEALCIEALITKSKDLQLAAWLVEAWTMLDGINGYNLGIQVFISLTEASWNDIHPQIQNSEDMESRLMIFEWMDTTLSSRLLSLNLTNANFDQTGFSLGYLKSAQHSDAAKKRLQKPTTTHSVDQSKTVGTVEEFQKSMDLTPDTYLAEYHKDLNFALKSTLQLKDSLINLVGSEAPSFSNLLGTLKEMDRIINNALQTRKPPESIQQPSEEQESSAIGTSSSPTSSDFAQSSQTPTPVPSQKASSETLSLSTRKDAYKLLDIIATFLEQNDPHSLAPQLIRQLVRWENKSVLDILNEFAQTPAEYEALMKVLGVTLPKD